MAERKQVLRKLLDKVAKERQYQNCEIKIKAVSSGGANYSSELYEITVSETKKPHLHIFAKISVMNEHIRKQSNVESLENEIFYFTELTKIFEKLQDKHDVPKQYRLIIPKFYGYDLTYLQEILLFENIGVLGYQSFDRFKTADWSYTLAAFEELAKFHALSIAYIEEDPERFKKYSEINKTAHFLGKVYDSMLKQSIPQALEVTRDENKDKMNNHFSNLDVSEIYKKYFRILKRPVLVHGDYRPNNLMHKVNDDGTYEIVVLDFQTLQIGCPITDLLYFIFCSTDEEFRKQHFNTLIEYYYTELGLSLKRLHISIDVVYPREDFDLELKEMILFGLYISIMLLPVLTVDPQDAPVINDIDDMAIKGNSMYVDRLNGIINDYVKWGLL